MVVSEQAWAAASVRPKSASDVWPSGAPGNTCSTPAPEVSPSAVPVVCTWAASGSKATLRRNRAKVAGSGSNAWTAPVGPTSVAHSVVYQPMYAPASRQTSPGRSRRVTRRVIPGS